MENDLINGRVPVGIAYVDSEIGCSPIMSSISISEELNEVKKEIKEDYNAGIQDLERICNKRFNSLTNNLDNTIAHVFYKIEKQRLENEKVLLLIKIEQEKIKARNNALESLSWFKRLFKRWRIPVIQAAEKEIDEKYRVDFANCNGLIMKFTFEYFKETYNPNFLKEKK